MAETPGFATLYTFKRDDGSIVRVVWLTDSFPNGWHTWGDEYKRDHPDIGDLIEIGGIEFVDARGG